MSSFLDDRNFPSLDCENARRRRKKIPEGETEGQGVKEEKSEKRRRGQKREEGEKRGEEEREKECKNIYRGSTVSQLLDTLEYI